MVGVHRFELWASASQTQRSARLSYTPWPLLKLNRYCRLLEAASDGHRLRAADDLVHVGDTLLVQPRFQPFEHIE